MQVRRKKTADIVTLIEFLLEYDTAGDPITGLKWSRRTTDKLPWGWATSVSRSVPTPLLVSSTRWAIPCASITRNFPPISVPIAMISSSYLGALRQRFQRRGLPIVSLNPAQRLTGVTRFGRNSDIVNL